ncbi:MAG: hypothetical protein K1000chlam2_01714 [Chlamydiae bacterium]|nr:hypothetical protein [Chlamydiota bacterium]
MKRVLLFLSMLFLLKGQAEDAWTSSIVIAKSKEILGHPHVAIDESRNVIAVWEDCGLHGIYSSVFDAATHSWGLPERLSEVNGHEENIRTPSLSMDTSGNAIAIWGGKGIHAAYYDFSSKRWLPYGDLLKNDECCFPSISFDGDGNAIAVWHNEGASAIQVSHFDKSTMTWSESKDLAGSTSYWGFLTHEYSPRAKVTTDNFGNAIAMWIENKGKERNILQAAYYDRLTNMWGNTINVSDEVQIFGFDVCMSSNSNAIAAFSHLISSQVTPEVVEFNMNRLTWECPGSIGGIGSQPMVAINASNNKALGCLWCSIGGLQFVSAIYDESIPTENWVDEDHLMISNSFVIFYDLSMDGHGNVIAAWNERNEDIQIERASYYSMAAREWTQPKTLSVEPNESLGETAVSMHPCGHAAILWNGFDEAEEQHILHVAIFQTN